NNKSYTGAMFENPYPPFFIYLPNTINNYVSNKLISKKVKPTGFSFSFMTFQPSPLSHTFSNSTWGQINPMLVGNYSMNIFEDQGFLTKIKQAFCATTGNPGDCLAKVSVSPPPVMPVFFEIDNFKAYGIKKLITGLENAAELQLKEKHIVKSVDFLGREIPDLANYKGPAIIMFSDGSREKRVF
ncbi:MAG: hypothetical protein H7329_20755, partial [Opitutaceae bacterium]|nr:hypothetical protein [Cytophagales bacterium]